jgi:hypothetical protein
MTTRCWIGVLVAAGGSARDVPLALKSAAVTPAVRAAAPARLFLAMVFGMDAFRNRWSDKRQSSGRARPQTEWRVKGR